MNEIRAYLLFTSKGSLLVLTKYDFAKQPEMLPVLSRSTSGKFIAYELPFAAVKDSYSAHLSHVFNDPSETRDNIKTLDNNTEQIFKNVRFKDLSAPIIYDPQ